MVEAAAIRRGGIVAIVRGEYGVAEILAIGETLADASIETMEVALNTPDALAAIGELAGNLGDRMLVGAGTVRTPAEVAAVADAGGRFLVSPSFDARVLEAAAEHDLLYVPGVFTPTEAVAAHAAGCGLLKLFPTDVGGPAYLRALRAPLPEIDFVPTGGVTAANAAEFAAAGAAALGIGSALVARPGQPLDDVARRAREIRSAWDGATAADQARVGRDA
jgi:Entner-Doudoroff aldolase